MTKTDVEIVYDLIDKGKTDQIFTYEDLADALDLDSPDLAECRQTIYGAVARARRMLLVNQQRSVRTVRDVGYRVMRPEEHLPAAQSRAERAVNSLERGVELLANVEVESLPDQMRPFHEAQLQLMGGLYHAVVESDLRRDEARGVVELIRERQQIDDLRLKALETDAADEASRIDMIESKLDSLLEELGI